jgi:hypothetical protein
VAQDLLRDVVNRGEGQTADVAPLARIQAAGSSAEPVELRLEAKARSGFTRPRHPVAVSLETSADGTTWETLVEEVHLRDGETAEADAVLPAGASLRVAWSLPDDGSTAYYWLTARIIP